MKSLMRLWALLLIIFYLGASALPLVAFASTTSFSAKPTLGAAPLMVTFTSRYGYPQGSTGERIVLDFDDGSQPQIVNCSNTQSKQAGICDTPASIQHTYAAGLYEPLFESISSAPGQPATVLGTTTIAVGSLPACRLRLNTNLIPVGGSITLRWSSINATAGAITNVGNVGPSGSINLLPSSAAYTTYIGSFTGLGGTANCSATVQVSTGGSNTSGGTSGGTNNGTNGTTAAPTAGASTVTPAAAAPQGALVPCGRGIFNSSDTTNDPNNSTGCQACNLAQLIQNIITFAIGLSIPIAAALFAWAGVLYFTSAGDHHKLEQAKAIFKNAFIGFLIAITAWLVINTALNVIFSQGEFAGSSWFTIQCSTTLRPVTGSISDVLTKVLGNAPVTDSSISTGGTPTPGSAAYTTAQQQTAIDSVYYDLYNACSAGDDASCTAYQAMPDPSKATLAQVLQASTPQLQSLCDGGDKASCDAYLAINNPTTITPDSSLFINASNIPASGSAAYTTAQKQTTVDDIYYALYNDCFNNNNQTSCTAYQALPDPTKATLAQITQASTDQLNNICQASGGSDPSCTAIQAINNPTSVTPDPTLFIGNTSGSGSVISNPQMAAQLAAACAQDNLSSSNCSIAQQIAMNESSGGNKCTTSGTGAAGCMQVLATTACGVDSSISSACGDCLASKQSLSAACAPVIQTIVNNPQLGTNLGVQYIANLQNTPILQSYEAQSGACQITAAAYYAGPQNVKNAGGVIANIVIPNAAPNAPTAAQYVAKACAS